MHTILIGIDDTDGRKSAVGTGRLARRLAHSLVEQCGGAVWGVLRHQLPRLEGIPYTSNNSSACIVLDMPVPCDATTLIQNAQAYIVAKADPEGDPGLCVLDWNDVGQPLVDHGLTATGRRLTQAEAMAAASGGHLSGLGGTNDGIIGAAAAVGLTRHGWCGRFIEFGHMRSAPVPRRIGQVQQLGIRVVCVDRDPAVPLPDDSLVGGEWLRPSLWAGGPVLQVKNDGPGRWTAAHGKRKKKHDQPKLARSA